MRTAAASLPAPPLRQTETHPIRVAVADGHPLYRDGLTRWLADEAGMEIAVTAADGWLALRAIREELPDVAVVEYELRGLDGPHLASAIRRDGLPTRVLVLAARLDSAAVFRSIGAGATGFLSKDAEPSDLRDAIATVAHGGVTLPPAAQTCIASEIRLRHNHDRPALTVREREVLALVARDCTTAQVAGRLHLSAATVKTHLQRVYDKLEVSDRAAAVAAAMRLGLLE
jgi:two-component system, NarL family, nitrate/nitrite response regulator NarL